MGREVGGGMSERVGPRARAREKASAPSQPRPQVRVRRAELASIFVAFLIGIAFQELVVGLREAVLSGERQVFYLAGIFLLTSIRFLIGAHLHLTSPQLTMGPGGLWLFDLMVITIEMIGLILVADFAGLDTPAYFFRGLIVVLLVDVAWVIVQWAMGAAWPSLKRASLPWGWAILNAALVVGMWLLPKLGREPFGDSVLMAALAMNAVAFVVDLWFVDHFDLL